MRKVAVVLLFLAALGCDTNTILQTPTEPEVPEATVVSGGWQGVMTSSTVPNAVWAMTLSQEATVAAGTWADDVNDYRGSAQVTVTADNQIIGTITIRTIASCTESITSCGACAGSATVRGTASDGLMDWQTDGWPECPGSPIQVRVNWRRAQ